MDASASALFAFVSDAYARQSIIPANARVSKRHPLGENRTGPEAAHDYEIVHVRSNTSIRKRIRVARIAAGERPLKYDVPGKREMKLLKKQRATA